MDKNRSWNEYTKEFGIILDGYWNTIEYGCAKALDAAPSESIGQTYIYKQKTDATSTTSCSGRNIGKQSQEESMPTLHTTYCTTYKWSTVIWYVVWISIWISMTVKV